MSSHRKKPTRTIAVVFLSLTLVALIPAWVGAAFESTAAFEFALIGDYPYTPRDDAGMPHLLADLREDGELAFVVHLGDLHSPLMTACSESLFRERREWFRGLGVPFVLTPGDNDWADCENDPLGSLETLRRVFYSDPSHAGGEAGFAIRSQSEGADFPEIVENAIWERAGVVFATLHMIGPGLVPWPDETADTRVELIAAAEAWLEEIFRVARERDARGVFLATQVSLWTVSGNPEMIDLLHPGLASVPTVFSDFEQRLIRNAREFGRPVVLANGDTHSFRVDKPLADRNFEVIQTFTRVEGFGSPHGHWVRVRVDPGRGEVFQFEQELVPENLYTLIPREERQDGFEDAGLARFKPIVRTLQAIPKGLAILGAFTLVFWVVKGIRRLRS